MWQFVSDRWFIYKVHESSCHALLTVLLCHSNYVFKSHRHPRNSYHMYAVYSKVVMHVEIKSKTTSLHICVSVPCSH